MSLLKAITAAGVWCGGVCVCACMAAACKPWAAVQEEHQMTRMPKVQLVDLPPPGSPDFVVHDAPVPVAPPAASSGAGVNAGAIIGGCAAAAVLVVVMVAVLLLLRRRRRKRKPALGKAVRCAAPMRCIAACARAAGRDGAEACTQGSPAANTAAPPPTAPVGPLLDAQQVTGPSGPLIAARSTSLATDGLTAFSRSTTGTTTTAVVAVGPCDGRSALADDNLDEVLNGMHARGEVLMGVYEFLGASSRRHGGQGLVQFVRRMQNGAEHAIKFFSDRRAFSRELELYKNPTLRAMMPAVSAIQVHLPSTPSLLQSPPHPLQVPTACNPPIWQAAPPCAP